MKTIFIPILLGVEARNVLRTDVTKKLISYGDIRIVFFVSSKERKEYYEKEFASDQIIFEVFSQYNPSYIERILAKFKVYAFRSETMDNKRKLKLATDGTQLWYYGSLWWNRFWARTMWRKILRWADYYLVRKEHFKKFFDTYNPDLVFLGHLFGDDEVAMLREAKRRGIVSVGLINSWDKLTSRSMLRLIPDYLFVPNQITYSEAMQYQDVPKEKIVITGAPQFDMYFNRVYTPRNEFLSALGIDSDKKVILICPIGKAFSSSDWKILEYLQLLHKNNHIPNETHFIVRFPPNDVVDKNSDLDPALFTFQTPGVRWSKVRGVDWDITEQDIDTLAHTVYHCNIVIPFWSTMNIDGAILDKPHINIDFDIEGGVYINNSFYQYQSTHYQKILKTGSPTMVYSIDELAQSINVYLKNPQKNKEERKKMVLEQIFRLDGRAGETIAEILYKIII